MVTYFWISGYSTMEKARCEEARSCPLHVLCLSGAVSQKWKGLLLTNRRSTSGLWIWGRVSTLQFPYVSSCKHNYQALFPLIPVSYLTSVQNSEIPNMLAWICASTLVLGFTFFYLRDLFLFFWSGAQHTPGSHNREEAVSWCSLSWAVITICQECSLFCNSAFPHSTIV